MRILILSEAFPPETKSCSTLFFELAESLTQAGHQVSVITRMPKYNLAEGVDLAKIAKEETLSGVKVYRCSTPPLARHVPLLRGFEHFILGWLYFWRGLWLGQHEIILIYSPPLPLGLAGYWLSKIKGGKLVSNVQDLYPQTVIDLGLLKNRFIIWLSKRLERFIYSKSDALTVHSAGNKRYLIDHGATASKVKVVYNWVDIEVIKPGPKENAFSQKHHLSGKFVVSFAGVMGFAQGLSVVVEAAVELKKFQDIIFVMVGDGIKKQELVAQTEELDLSNILFIPTQPVKLYPLILQASDVSLVVLDKTLVTPVVPGKLFSIMAAGIPAVASLPMQGDAPKIIQENQVGLIIPAGNSRLLAQAILKLYNDPYLKATLGKNGRTAAEKIFSRQVCVKAYSDIFIDLLKGGK